MNTHPLAVKTAAALLVAALHAAPARAQKQLSDYAQPGLKDLSATVKVLSYNNRELAKLGKGYSELYKLERQEIWCREPGQVRIQGKKGLLTVRNVTNGDRRLTEVSTLRIRKVESLAKEPGKGDSISDLGIITPGWVSRVQSQWLRTETRNGRPHEVFQFWHPEDRRAKRTIVVDPATKVMVECIAHHRGRRRTGFKRRIVYSEPKQFNGIWVPTRAAVYNDENKLGGEVRYDSIKVNSGLQESLFKI
jgi:hypothetical protein